jgi:hypothetical protein
MKLDSLTEQTNIKFVADIEANINDDAIKLAYAEYLDKINFANAATVFRWLGQTGRYPTKRNSLWGFGAEDGLQSVVEWGSSAHLIPYRLWNWSHKKILGKESSYWYYPWESSAFAACIVLVRGWKLAQQRLIPFLKPWEPSWERIELITDEQAEIRLLLQRMN